MTRRVWEMKPGDPIWYRRTQRGGYAFQWDVPGYFVKRTATRVVIELVPTGGKRRQITVHPHSVRPRDPQKGTDDA